MWYWKCTVISLATISRSWNWFHCNFLYQDTQSARIVKLSILSLTAYKTMVSSILFGFSTCGELKLHNSSWKSKFEVSAMLFLKILKQKFHQWAPKTFIYLINIFWLTFNCSFSSIPIRNTRPSSSRLPNYNIGLRIGWPRSKKFTIIFIKCRKR